MAGLCFFSLHRRQLGKLISIKEIVKIFKIFCNTYNLLQGSGELHRKYGISKSRIIITICSVLRTVSIDQLKKEKIKKIMTWYSCSNEIRVRLCQEWIIIHPIHKYLLKSLLKQRKCRH